MVTLIFDKDLETERRISIDSFNEQPLSGSFCGTRRARVERAEDVPDVSALVNNPTFFTIEAVNGGDIPIRITGSYNRISVLSAAYEDIQKYFTLSLTLTFTEAGESETQDRGETLFYE